MIEYYLFSEPGCPPCLGMETYVRELENLTIFKSAPTERKKYGIPYVPILLKMCDGVEVDRLVGLVPQARIKEFISE